MISIILILSCLASCLSAPVEVSPLITIVTSDPRTENLRKHKFVAECRQTSEFSKSLCFAMFDVALSFNISNLSFNRDNATYEAGKYCEALAQVLPDTPYNNESSMAFKDKAQWFKDTLKDGGEDLCGNNCFYTDPNTYDMTLKPVCRFLFNQYSFLSNQSNVKTGKSDEIKPQETKAEMKAESVGSRPASDESESEAKAVPAAGMDSLPTGKQPAPLDVDSPANSASQNVIEVVTQKATAPASVVLPAKDEVPAQNQTKPIATPAATTVEVKLKTETTKAAKVDEELNIEGQDINGGLFDDPSETPGKDADKDVEPNGDPDLADSYDDDEDLMARDNNNIPEAKFPPDGNAPLEPVEDDPPVKKIEVVAFEEDPDSNFFTYLCAMMFTCILLYVMFQSRHKILALFLEGRRGNRRGSRDRSRGGSKAAYSKLDCNLEEAIMSKKSLSGKSMDVIY